MRLLIVEDEYGIRTALEKGLTKLGYAVDIAEDGEKAVEAFFNASYDLVLLDLNLPKMDGLEVLKIMRAEDPALRVLILSARSQVTDKIQGLDLGANDYIAKPFHFMELDARVRALLRRKFEEQATVIQVSGVDIHTDTRKVYHDGNEILLTAKEYGILEYLALHPGQPVSAEELIEHVWNESVNELTTSVKVHISTLRRKLPEGLIKNTRGSGYYV